MSTHAQGIFELQSWDENAYLELEGDAKLTRASVAQKFTGDLDGDGSVEWLMCYADGRVGGRSGSFVLETLGTFEGGEAKGTWSIVPRSGTGELRDITGTGGFAAPHGPKATVELDYDFE